MGSLSKRIGQLAAGSLESESAQILRTIRPNKIPNSLSQKLDTTLKDSHDMRVFGLGTLASLSSKERYMRFTHALYGVYSTMENELDKCCSDATDDNRLCAPVVAHFWNKHAQILRRADHLKNDVLDVTNDYDSLSFSDATEEYMEAIRIAGRHDRDTGGGLLLGHAYTRYLADLMGGQMLGTPTRMALDLKDGTPRQYSFLFPVDRKSYVESIYQDLNEAGDMMTGGGKEEDVMFENIVAEARAAFGYNVKIYAEEPYGFDSVIGMKNIVTGWMTQK